MTISTTDSPLSNETSSVDIPLSTNQSPKMNDEIRGKLKSSLDGPMIDMTITEIAQSQDLPSKSISEAQYLDYLPYKTLGMSQIEWDLTKSNPTGFHLSAGNNEYSIVNLKEFSINSPASSEKGIASDAYKEYAIIENVKYEINQLAYRFFSGEVANALDSHVTVTMLDNEVITILGEATVIKEANSLQDDVQEISLDFQGIPNQLASSVTKTQKLQGNFPQIGNIELKSHIVAKTDLQSIPLNFKTSSTDELSSMNSIQGTTDTLKRADIDVYIDGYLSNDPSNVLYIGPVWGQMYDQFRGSLAGNTWMPHINMNRYSTTYWACSSCNYNYWSTFLDDFASTYPNAWYADASYIWTGVDIHPYSPSNPSGTNGFAKWAPSAGDNDFGVFGWTNSRKDTYAYAGSENGWFRPEPYASITTGHELGHLMGDAHEDAQVNGDTGYPGHGANSFCTGSLYWLGIGYHLSIMWHEFSSGPLTRYFSFSSYSTTGITQYTLSPYNSDNSRNNLYYVRGTAYLYCIDA